MAYSYQFDPSLYAIRVVLEGAINASDIGNAFKELYNGQFPADANALWSVNNCTFDIDVMDVFQLAKFTQSERDIEGYPATVFVVDDRQSRILCEEYKALVIEAPYEVAIFDAIEDAENWLRDRNKAQGIGDSSANRPTD